jgi:hypothetical protein
LAIKPTEADTFFKEVDEELRKERITQFVTRYGWALLAAGVLVLAAIGGVIWWKAHREQVRGQQAETLVDALDKMETGNRNAALPKLAELADSGITGYRVAAEFARANAQIDANQMPAAIATLSGIAGNEDYAEPYRNAALVRQTQLEFDHLTPQAVIQRLQPLATPESAWFGTAGEMVAIAQMKLHHPERAGPLFARIARDENVPPSIRSRAIQMAGSLGIDASDAAEQSPPTPAAPDQAAAAPAPAPASQGNAQ